VICYGLDTACLVHSTTTHLSFAVMATVTLVSANLQILIPWVLLESTSPVLKQPHHKADHSFASTASINVGCWTSTSAYIFMAWQTSTGTTQSLVPIFSKVILSWLLLTPLVKKKSSFWSQLQYLGSRHNRDARIAQYKVTRQWDGKSGAHPVSLPGNKVASIQCRGWVTVHREGVNRDNSATLLLPDITFFCQNSQHILTFKNRTSYIIYRAYSYPTDVAFYIFFSTNISTEYFKHAAHSPFLLFKVPFIS